MVGLATQDKAAKPLRQKIDAVCFGWFFPFFFVGAGVKLHLATFIHVLSTALLVPLFLAALLLVRGMPAWFYGKHLAAPERLPFALYSSVASLSLVVITDIGVRTGAASPHIASALIGAALLSVLIFPTLAGVQRPLAAAPPGTAEASERGRRLTPVKRGSRDEFPPRSAG